MASFIRVSDIPADELYLLPILGLRQQIREDRNRPSSPTNTAGEQDTHSPSPGAEQHAGAEPRNESPAATARFVTDWQLQNEPYPSARFRVDREDLKDEDVDDWEDEDASEAGDSSRSNEDLTADETFDVLYVDLGGEG